MATAPLLATRLPAVCSNDDTTFCLAYTKCVAAEAYWVQRGHISNTIAARIVGFALREPEANLQVVQRAAREVNGLAGNLNDQIAEQGGFYRDHLIGTCELTRVACSLTG